MNSQCLLEVIISMRTVDCFRGRLTMVDGPNLARIGALLADPARAQILWMLMDRSLRPAGELAFGANISAQSASQHLAKLVDGGLLAVQAQGRHRYFRISSSEVANAVETLAVLAEGHAAGRARSVALSRAVPSELRFARTCYDHLAGELAVRLVDGMMGQTWLETDRDQFRLTDVGASALDELGVDVMRAQGSRRSFAPHCVDWSQRRPHVGGALGAALLDCYLKKGWMETGKTSRLVRITPRGQAALDRLLPAL
jgi:DNA-binding transcriptional ArsR family regulator